MAGGIFGDVTQQNGTGIPYMPQFGGFGGFGQPSAPGMDLSQTLGGIGQGLTAFSSLANLYGMFKNLSFQKKAFRFAQEGTKRNFNANAQAFNNEIDDQYTNRAAMAKANNWAVPDSGIFSQRKIAQWG
jgi:hypothetical protein